jgi:excisionase family DNA binding protein
VAKRGKAKEPAPEVYKPSEVAKMLRVDLRTVYGMIEREELPQIKAGRVIRIPRGPVDTLLGRKPATVKGN